MPSIKKRLLLFSLILLLVARGCTPQNPSSSETSSEINGLKIYTTQEGIYHITAQELGWPELPSKLSLTLRGEPQPFWITKETHPPTLYFYAPEPDDPYTTYAIFILTSEEGGQPRPTETYHPAETSARTTYTAHLRLEENISYQPLALESPWLGQRIIAPQTLTLPITLHKVASGPGTLQVRLWGKTQASAEPDHHIQLTLNGEPIANQTWDGQAPQIISAPIPENTLTTGENILEITAPGDTEAPVDIVFLDWVEIAYPRQSQASNDTLRFEGGDTPLRLTGFGAPPTIYDVTAPEKAQRLVSADAVPDDPTFTGEAGHRYLAIGPGGYLSPDQISPLTRTPDLTSPTQGADYLAIGPAHLLTPLEPLLSHRQDQNLTTLAIPAAAIYDQFGDGFPDPVAIRNFLRYANQSWESVPQYVLLVGDATYDPKGHQFSTEGHLLPTLPIDTLHGGQTGSDVPLAQLNGPKDPWPDLALGRVPTREPEQIQAFVEKTIAYENEPPTAAWNKHIVAIADGQESGFKDDAQAFLNLFQESYQSSLLAPAAGETDGASQIQTTLEEGAFLTAYFGHGSLKMWGKDKLFTTKNTTQLNNKNRLPIILNFTCLTGLFTHPTEESLAESLLFHPAGGAVAVLAPSSLTLPTNQSYLSDAIAQALLSGSHQRLGEVVLEAWRQVPVDDPNSRDVLGTFMLFGDPALVIKFE